MTLEALPERPDGVRVLAGGGELDVAALPTVQPAVPGLVAGAAAIVLDLSAVTFFDSSGVRLVDTVARACGKSGAGFRVVAPPGAPARRVLEIVGMTSVVADDLDTAVAACQPAGGR